MAVSIADLVRALQAADAARSAHSELVKPQRNATVAYGLPTKIQLDFTAHFIAINNPGSFWLHFPQADPNVFAWVPPSTFNVVIPMPADLPKQLIVDTQDVPTNYAVDVSNQAAVATLSFYDEFPQFQTGTQQILNTKSLGASGLTVFNVQAPPYNAKGDGVTDDTAAIQAAINAAALNNVGGIVYFPPGYYRTSNTLTVPSRVTLLGAGISGTSEAGVPVVSTSVSMIQMLTGTNLDLIRNSDQVNGNSEIEIAHLMLDGSGSQAAGNKILNLTKVWRSRVHDCVFRGAEPTNRYGLYMAGDCEEDIVKDCRFLGAGVFVTGCNGIRLAGLEINVSPTVEAISVVGPAHGIMVRDCQCFLSLVGVKFFSGVSDSTIEGNHVWNHQQSGIYIDQGCKYLGISGNISKDNSQVAGGVHYGIRIGDSAAAPCTDCSVVGNEVIDDQGVPTQNGILVGDDCDFCVVADNNVRPNAGTAILFGTGAHNRAHQNPGFNPQGVAAIAVGASPFIYTNNDNVDEQISIDGGTITTVVKNGITLHNFGGAAARCEVWLGPGEAVTVTYTVAPTMNKDRK